MKILIADGHTNYRKFLHTLLKVAPGVEVVGTASDGSEALELVEKLEPDEVLMDIGIAGIGGLEATRRIKARRKRTRVILLSILADTAHVVGAQECGADAFVPKTASIAVILDLVKKLGEPEAGRKAS